MGMKMMIVQNPTKDCLIVLEVDQESFEVVSMNSLFPNSVSIYDPENPRVRKNRGSLCTVVEVSDKYVKVKFDDSDKLTKIENFLDLKEYVPPEPEPPPKSTTRSSNRSRKSSGTTKKRSTTVSKSTKSNVGTRRNSRVNKN